MYFGCQCSSARCSRLLSDRLTLLGIFSAEIMTPRDQGHKGLQRTQRPRRCLVSLCILCPPLCPCLVLCTFPVEFGSALLAVHLQRALVADGVRALEDPVLPRGQPSEDLRLH